MTIKSQIDYICPQCGLAWLPFCPGLACPQCGRPLSEGEVTPIIAEALESAQFNKRLYGRFELEFWTTRRLGDRYLAWGFKALDIAAADPSMAARNAAVAALIDLDLEEMTPYRSHILMFLETLVERYREAVKLKPDEWGKLPEPEKPFFGRKIIEDA